MINRLNRSFLRKPPTRDAKSIYIFCEGAKREMTYFNYFKEVDSRINVEVISPGPHDNTTPLGIGEKALTMLIISEENPTPKYEIINGDEVWIVIDRDIDKLDSRRSQIDQLMQLSSAHNWNVACSNPCFEVWLYYHLYNEKPIFEGIELCSNWKRYVNDVIAGGFNVKKHNKHLADAIRNAENNYSEEKNGELEIGVTQIYRLGHSLWPFVQSKIDWDNQ